MLLFKAFLVITFLALIGGAFYWYAYRPSEIKKKCSIVTEKTSEVKAITKAEVEKSLKENKTCKDEAKKNPKYDDKKIHLYTKEQMCDYDHPILKEREYKGIGTKTRSSTDAEYKKCLRKNGI